MYRVNHLDELYTTIFVLLLCNRTIIGRWNGFTCVGGGGGRWLMSSPLRDHICASKRQRKRTLIDWCTVAGRLCNGTKQAARNDVT